MRLPPSSITPRIVLNRPIRITCEHISFIWTELKTTIKTRYKTKTGASTNDRLCNVLGMHHSGTISVYGKINPARG